MSRMAPGIAVVVCAASLFAATVASAQGVGKKMLTSDGGVDLLRHCRQNGYEAVLNLDGTGNGWRCAGDLASISVDMACREQYGPDFRAQLTGPGGANDWRCVQRIPGKPSVSVPSSTLPTGTTVGLVGYWSFDDGTASDNSGNGNNGMLVNGPAFVAGKNGQALNLNGSGQYVNIGNVLNPGTGDFSVFAWVKTTQGGGYNMIVSKRDSSLINNSGYQLFQNSTGGVSFTFGDGSSNRVKVDSPGPRINDGTWHLVGVVYTRSGNGILYVDGTPATNGTGSITSQRGSVGNAVPLRIGTENQNGPMWAWGGAIDEVRIYNRALSAQEISDLYATTPRH